MVEVVMETGEALVAYRWPCATSTPLSSRRDWKEEETRTRRGGEEEGEEDLLLWYETDNKVERPFCSASS